MSGFDFLLTHVPSGELRLVAELLPDIPARVEHCVYCRCQSGPFIDCSACDTTGFTSRSVCLEGDCAACDRFFSVCMPGHEQQMRFLGGGYEWPPCSVCGGGSRHEAECAVVYPEAA